MVLFSATTNTSPGLSRWKSSAHWRCIQSGPWMTTNPRGALSNGTLEAYWSFDRLEDGMIADASPDRNARRDAD